MTTHTQQSPHLGTARRLLDEVAAAHSGDDLQAKATAAAAHAILVLAEQVAGVRIVIAADAVNGRAAAHRTASSPAG
jgi:hypothetical protein